MADKAYTPEWVPEGAQGTFATQVMPGVRPEAAARPQRPLRPAALTAKDYVDGILSGDRMILSRAITVIESNAAKHADLAQEILQAVLPYTGKSSRVGITGVPGAGKSTFIENLGCMLCNQGHKTAILAVDPSSPVSRGSVLGERPAWSSSPAIPMPSFAPRRPADGWGAWPGKAGRPCCCVKRRAMT